MRILTSRILWGVLLITAGILFLLENLGVVAITGLIWSALFAIAGIVFIITYIDNHEHWWALIPGIILFFLGLMMGLSQLPGWDERWGGALFLGGIGLAFVAVYLSNRTFWWAVIPAGVMLTLAAVTGLETTSGWDTGAVFFLGLGLTFALVAILPNPEGNLRWAFIPAAVLLILGLVTLAAVAEVVNYIWPFVLILAGLFFLFRTFRTRRNIG